MSGVAGADRIKSRQDFQQFLKSYQQIISKFPGFQSLQPSGSYNSDPSKMDFGDIDIIVHITSSKDKATVKKELQAYLDSLPDNVIVPFTSAKHAGKRTYNAGELVSVRYHDNQLGYSAQIDNIVALDQSEATFKQQFLDMPAEKQGLVLGLVKIAAIETNPAALFQKLGISAPTQLQQDQEYEFNLSSVELQLRLVTYEPGTYKQADRKVIWTSRNFDDLQKLLYQYNLDANFDQLLAQSKQAIKNPRSNARMQGVFSSMITVKSGEVGTAKGAGKEAALGKIQQTFKESRSIFRSLMETSAPRKVIFAFGRFQPPTVGHELLINVVKQTAANAGADHVIYVSKTQDAKTNPLDIATKMAYLQKMFPGTNFVAADATVRTPIEALKHLNQKYTDLVWIAGSDRLPAFSKLANDYNGKDYQYQNLQVVSSGNRDPDSEGTEGMSGTKMREAALAGNLEAFRSGLPASMTEDDAMKLMNLIQRGLTKTKVGEARQSNAAKLQKAFQREQEKGAAARERGNNILNPKKAGETPKPAGAGSGEVKMSEDHQTSRLWMMISNLEKQAKLTKNDIKRDHLLRTANDLRAKLPSSDQGVDEGEVVQFPKKHKGDLDGFDDCPKCGRDLMGGTYMGHKVKVCNPCKQVYLPPNSGIDQQGNKTTDEDLSRRGFLKGVGAAAAAGAAGKASAIAGAFPSPSTRQKWANDAAASNRAEAQRQAELQRQANAARAAKLDADTKDVDRLNKVNYHGKDAPKPTNAEWDGDSDFLDLDGTQYAMASRMPISGDEPSDMKLISTKQGRQVYIWTRRSLKGTHGRYFYPAANPNTIKESTSNAMANTAKRLTDPTDGKTAKLRAAGDKKREDQLKYRDISKKNEGEGDPEGVPHLSKELLQHIVQQIGTEGAHAIVKSLEWGDGAAKELLQLITQDLKQDIATMKECAGVGIITKQNSTKDVNKNTPMKNLKAFKLAEKMMPASNFAGSDKNKLGSAGQWKNTGPKKNKPAKAGDLVGGMEEGKKKGADGKACWDNYKYAGTENGKDKCVKVGEDVENIMGSLIESILKK